MKEFLLKHPFWAYCMLNCVCITIENIVNGRPKREKYLDQVVDIADETVKELKKKNEKKNNVVPMGFHFNREEA